METRYSEMQPAQFTRDGKADIQKLRVSWKKLQSICASFTGHGRSEEVQISSAGRCLQESSESSLVSCCFHDLGSSESQEKWDLLPHELHKVIIARCLKSTRLGHGPEKMTFWHVCLVLDKGSMEQDR